MSLINLSIVYAHTSKLKGLQDASDRLRASMVFSYSLADFKSVSNTIKGLLDASFPTYLVLYFTFSIERRLYHL